MALPRAGCNSQGSVQQAFTHTRRLRLFEPFRVGRSGTVNHQNPYQVVFESFSGHQTIAGEDVFCFWMPEEVKLVSSWKPLCLCPGK
jgi:hypothetical protein